MSEDVRERCLEPFFTTHGERGSGLGLPMVSGIIQQHGGELKIRSAEGLGTAIEIRLPCRVVRDDRPPTLSTVDIATAATALNVLVVDDERLVRDSLRDLVRDAGHRCEAAESGADALRDLDEQTFDVLVTDRGMPGMTGDQLAAAARAAHPALRIVMLTGYGVLMDADDECPPGVDAVLAKPVDGTQIAAALARVVSRAALVNDPS